MTVAVLCIGTELTRGEIVNTNATWLCDEVSKRGLEVVECLVVADDEAKIIHALSELGARTRLILSTGGLGPTTDDITSNSVARLLGVPLARDEASLAAIRERFARLGRPMSISNEKQADFPANSQILPNFEGTAPGFAVDIRNARAFFMPGVPSEMKPMFERSVVPTLDSFAQGGVFQIRIKTYGAPESTVNDLLTGVEQEFSVTLGYRAHFPEIEVKILAKRATHSEAVAAATLAATVVRERLASIIYAEGDITFAESVGQLLRERGLTLGLAESCTGGLLSKLVTDRSASDYFRGSIVCYDNSVKERVLGVSAQTLREHGAVSAEVARELAVGARRVLDTDIGLAITGIAGPTGGSADKPVGLVHLAVASGAGVQHKQIVYPRSREQIRMQAAFTGLALVRSHLLAEPHEA